MIIAKVIAKIRAIYSISIAPPAKTAISRKPFYIRTAFLEINIQKLC